ncbi:hypothetical protein EVAR_75217_1 [Eumeta japonica]|uniref:Uncharacterized protein n=1 Tax=Eumeta variegata TaxID=151549 RepID=A0A4C1V8X3_EUMVA|nr:hypothetical protein EVAR_75217_1 [Eumeta japonica]
MYIKNWDPEPCQKKTRACCDASLPTFTLWSKAPAGTVTQSIVLLRLARCRRRMTALWVPFERHHGIGGHVKFTTRTGNFGGDSGRHGARTGLMTFNGRN